MGTAINLWVDTTSDETTFDPYLHVGAEGDCITATGDDAFECTFPPPSFGCPAAVITPEAAGNYIALVSVLSSCAGTTAEYTIGADADVALTLTDAETPTEGTAITNRVEVNGSFDFLD